MESCKEKLVEHEEEVLFEVIGDYGPWQRNIFISIFLINIFVTWQNMAITFLAPNEDFRCLTTTYDELIKRNHFSNIKNFSYTKINECEYNVEIHPTINNSGTLNKTVLCTHWEYKKSNSFHTIIDEWDLVCEREWLVSLAKSIYMIGFMAATLISGPFSDSYGRLPTIIFCWTIMCVSSLLSVFSISYTMFIILRFFMAFGGCGLGTTGYILLMEITGPKRRSQIGITVQISGVIGMVTLPAITWFVKHWVYLQFIMSAPILGFICCYWVMSESPRWLMTNQKRKKFEHVIVKAAKKNGRTLPDDIENIIPFSSIKKRRDSANARSFVALVRTPEMRKRSINLAILWAVNAFIYYAFTYNTNDLGGNPYLDFFLSGVVEVPAFFLMFMAVRKGRRISTLIGMIITAVFSIAIIPLPHSMDWLIIAFTMIGKLGISGTFGILYLYTAEIFPTVIRNMSFGACSAFARIGSITAPFSKELGQRTGEWAPNALNGGLSLCAGLIVFFLPETKDKKIPDTIEEVESFKENDSIGKYSMLETFISNLETSDSIDTEYDCIYTRMN